jgi:hypothetical protein
MPNNQDAVKLLPGTGYQPTHAPEKLIMPTQSNVRPTPTPREQELEAQNKALWELVSRCEQAFNSITNITTDKVNAEFMLRKLRETDDIVCATLAAIQKAREAK